MSTSNLSGHADGYRHIALDQCASTNLSCFEQAEAGDPGKLWITAAEQTSAKASRGRGWTSGRGNLHASLLLIDPCEPKHFTELTFVAALAVCETLKKALPGQLVQLKWPNDVLVNEKKCSGILLESRLKPRGNQFVVGIGINCNHHPDTALFPATDIASEGGRLTAAEVFELLCSEFSQLFQRWNAGNGFPELREQWLNCAWGLGKVARVGLYDGKQMIGTFSGLDEMGQLLLVDESGTQTKIAVGDVFALPDNGEHTMKSGEVD